DNGAETITFPDGGTTPFKGGKLSTWEGGMRAPCVIRWPGVIKPGTIFNDIFASLDWLPTFVEIAGGPKGDDLNKQIMTGKYPGIVKTRLDGHNQIDYLTGKSPKSASQVFFYYSGSKPSAVRYKNWKIYFTMVSDDPAGFIAGPLPTPGPRSSTSSAIRSRLPSDSSTRPLWAQAVPLPRRRRRTFMTGT